MKIEKRSDVSGETPETQPQEQMTPKTSRKREISVLFYTIVLFVVALGLILLSYAIQRHASNALSNMTEQHGEFSAQALRNIEELQEMNLQLTQDLDQARADLSTAQTELANTRAALETAESGKETWEDKLREKEDRVKALEEENKELEGTLDEQTARVEALRALASLLGGGEDRDALLRALETESRYLDGEALELYNAYIENLNKEDGGDKS